MPDRSTADTAGTAETAGTAAASDITRQVDALLDRSTDGIVMDSRDRRAVVLSRQTVYQGAVFDVEDMRIALPAGGGDCVTVRRQVCRHAPCVVMLVHDEARDLYLLEREYRVGSDLFAYGLPAGLMDDGEDVEQAALRELAEETGVVPVGQDGVIFDHVGGVLLVGRHERRARQHHGHAPATLGKPTAPVRSRRTRGICVGDLAPTRRSAGHRVELRHRHTA